MARRAFAAVVAAILVIGQVSAVLGAAVPSRPTAEALVAARVQRGLLERLERGEVGRFIVEFSARPDLSGASRFRLKEVRGGFVRQQLTATASRSQAAALGVVGTEPSVTAEGYWLRNVLVVDGTGPDAAAIARRLAAMTGVRAIRAERIFPLIKPVTMKPTLLAELDVADPAWGVAQIKAPEVWATGNTGSGVVVANVDSGVDYLHPALINQYRGNLGGAVFDHDYDWFDPTGICAGEPCDNVGHGTHTMGTMVGGDAGGPFTPDVGVAPGARWIAAKGCEEVGCSESSLLAAGQFILAPTKVDGTDPDPAMAPDIVNNSWGGGPGDPFYREVVQAWRAAGIIPVFSSGNPGPACGDGGSPGDFPEAFSVGATDIDDQIADFSGRGPSAFEEKGINPDVTAPGVDVVSTVPGGGYEAFSGTSMAAPHTAGTLALMLSAEPGLSTETAFDAVRSTALDRIDTTCGGDADGDPNNVYGDGRIDAAQAVALVATGGHLAGTVTDAATSEPVSGAVVNATSGELVYSVVTGADGSYLLFLPAGTWQVTVDAFGYAPGVATGVEIVTDQTTTRDFALVLLPRFTVSGVVRAAEDGSPIEGASVVALGTPVPPAVTDSAGSYSLRLPVGSYTLRASAGGCTEPALAEIAGTTEDEIVQQDFALARKIDDFGHGCRPVPFTWDEATTETALYGDEFVGRLTLPFPFTFYGQSYDVIWIADNGYVNFLGPDQGNFIPVSIPTDAPPNAAIYALWQDLVVSDAGAIMVGTAGTAPDRRFVLEYRDVAVFGSTTTLDFQIVLHEQGETVELRYGVNPPDPGDGRSATIGIEDHNGTDALEFGFREDLLGSEVAYRYELVPSGVVRGVVTDANDGEPIAGAEVTATPGLGSTTTDTDGSYFLRLFPGTYTLSYARSGYLTAGRPATVTDGSDETIDVALDAPTATLDRTAIEVSLGLGETTTETVTLSNGGQATLDWEAKERDGGSDPPVIGPQATGSGTWIERASRTVRAVSNTGATVAARPSSFRWTATGTTARTMADLSVLVYADDPVHPAPETLVDQALQALGLSYTAHYDADFEGFVSDLETGSWDLVVFADDNFLPDPSVFDALDGYVQGGGRLIVHTWAVGADPGHTLWSTLGITPVSDDEDPPDPVHWWEPSHPAFTFPESVPEPTQLDDAIFGIYGQHVEPNEGGTAIAGYTEPGPDPNESALVLANADRTAFKGFLDGQNSADQDEDGTPDGVELWINLVNGIGNGFFVDVPWLSESPTTGSVPPGGNQPVEITIGGPSLAPGTYHGSVVFLTNAPKGGTQTVDVTLTVDLPAEFGAAGGTISDAHSGEPIAGASVALHAQWPGTTPYEAVATTDADGAYQVIGPEGSWPADVSATGYEGTALELTIVRGETTGGQDAAIHRDIPHASLEGGDPIVAVLLPDETYSATLTLSNPGGHEPLTFSIGEVNPGGGIPAATSVRGLPIGADPNAVTSRALPSARVTVPPRLQSAGDVLASWPTGLDLGWGVGYDGSVWLSDILEADDVCGASSACVNVEFGTDGTPTGVAHEAAWVAEWHADMAFDPGRGWIWQVHVGGDNGIVGWDPATGDVQQTLTGSPWSAVSQRGLAYDPAADVFYVGGWNEGIVYRVAGPSHATPGETLSQCSPADPTISGLAWNPAFGKLWVATNSDTDTIYLVDPLTCETQGAVPHPDGGGFGGAGLEMDAAGNLWTVGQGSGQAYLVESGLPNFSDVPWLTIAPTEGTVAPDGSVEIGLEIDNAGLPPGQYDAQVVIQTNDPENAIFTVPITLIVSGYRQGVNAGGPAYVDTSGTTWAADQAWTAGSFGYVGTGGTRTFAGDIAGTDDDALYRDQRANMVGYRFSDLPEGTYLVDLRFAELNLRRAGARVFSVSIEGSTGVFLLDVFEEAGGRRIAHDRTFLVEVTDGTLDIVFTAVRGDRPIVNAIMVTHMPGGGV